MQAADEPDAASAGFGRTVAQAAMRIGQRPTNVQPAGGLIGLGSSPISTILSRLRCATGSGSGIADSSADV